MAAFNVSVDDASPLISYSPAGAWTDHSNTDSIYAPFYSQRSWHTSSFPGASATIQFNGTGIWFYGANRPGYGSFNISIDGQSVPGDAHSSRVLFRRLLGGRSGLTNGPHTVVLTNTGQDSYVDLDTVLFETQVGSAGSVMREKTIDDASPAITYSPAPKDWVFDRLKGCHNDTIHFTERAGASAQLTFDGEGVAIYGTVSPGHADYNVTMDGITQSFQGGSNGLVSGLHMGMLLYFTNGLTAGPHNLTLTAYPAHSDDHRRGKFLDIDKIVVVSASDGTSTKNDVTPVHEWESLSRNQTGKNLSNVGASPPAYLNSRRPNAAIIGAGIAGGLLLLLLIMIPAFLLRRRRVQEDGGPPHQDRWPPEPASLPTRSVSLRKKLTIGRRRTQNLPMQAPPTSLFSPRTPQGSKVQNPFIEPSDIEKGQSDVEKGVEYSGPFEPKQDPFADDGRVRFASEPEVIQDANGGGWSGDDLRDQDNARPTRPARGSASHFPR
ncbi:hypothetical protein F5148DRAFT_598110 [Russula earlei]|uniref:Uncharacterized protein n=1 Tax=Russula earlei TaxID=71964 RepID=A0ACC0TV17_9AGAM|nr:hypothetical protein F5148DRAFT_598110 [Russula earlei]